MSMRATIWLMALLMAAPAQAGLRATYDQPADRGPLTIEIADNGDLRVGPPAGDMYGLLLGDVFYVVGAEGGQVRTARLEDVAAAFDRALPPVFGTLFGAAGKATAAQPGVTLQRIGPRTVGGRAGIAYTVVNPDGRAGELVVSEDPALAPVGRAMARFVEATMVMLRPLIGEGAATAVSDARATFALGTPLVANGGLTLRSVETVDVPAERLKLPARPQTVDEIVAGVKATPAP